MKNDGSSRPFVVVSLLAASLAPVQAQAQAASPPGPDWARGPNLLRLSYRPGFNVRANFRNTGRPMTPTDPGPATAGVDHFYDDGYNRVDSAGNLNNQTWFWGYDHPSQVPTDGYIYMHSLSTAPVTAPRRESDSPSHGLELSYQRTLGRWGRAVWGLEAAVNYTRLSIEAHNVRGSTVNLTTDAYALNDVVPPEPPYRGTFAGPGPVISDVPERTVTTATAVGWRSVEADLVGLRLGPSLTVPLNPRWALGLSGGLAVGWTHSDFEFQDRIGGPGAGQALIRSGCSSEKDWLVGGYVGASLSYQLSQAWQVFAGAQYQHLGSYSQQAADRQVEVDLKRAFFVTVGLGYSF